MAEILQAREAGPENLSMGADFSHDIPASSASPSPFSLLPPLEIASNPLVAPSTPTRGHARAASSQTALPLANPAFSFPLQPPSNAKIDPFSYSPTTYDSPTRSSRINHRRGGSEFIGGDGTLSGPGLMSASPTKAQDALPLPEQKPRRGHAHRRSGAISQHDIRAVMLSSPDSPVPTLFPRAENNTASPSEPRSRLFPSTETTDQKSLDSEALDVLDADAQIPPVVSRPRVGFSDRVEFIPRPVSTISSDAASSILTIRQGHSLNSSITSIRDTNSGSPSMRLSKRGSMSPRSSSYSYTSSPKEEPTTPTKRPSSSSALSQSRTANDLAENSKTKELLSSFRSGTAKHSLKASISTPNLLATSDQTKSFSPPTGIPTLHRPRSSPDIKTAARKSKGKSWAGNVFSRLTRHTPAPQEPASVLEPTQPVEQIERVDEQQADFSLEDVNFDDDTTCVITTVPTSSASSQMQDYIVAEPTTMNSRDSEESFAPTTLDLDATWLSLENLPARPFTGEAEATARRSFHRRTESAPTASTGFGGGPFNLRRGPAARMEDVFEEDEDDALPRPPTSGRFDSPTTSGSLPTSPCLTPFDGYFDRTISTAKPSIQSPMMAQSVDADVSEEKIETDGLERTSTGSEANSSGTITDISPAHHDFLHAEPPREELITPVPTSHTQTSGFNSFGPPSLRDPSLDGPRLYTANSSRTDQSTWSSTRPGEAQTLGYSTDTVPSLTETSSTRNSVYPSLASALPSPTFPGENASFFSGSGIGGRRVRPSTPNKRASLVSLSRLMNISHFEKSKLSLALSAADDEASSTREKRKGTRLSKLMFWKKKTTEQKEEST